MADLTQTAANVGVNASTTRVQVVQAGEAITQGQAIYKKASDSKYYKADVTTSTATAAAVGVAMTPAATDGYFVLALSGDIDLGATLVVGTVYVVSASGAIGPIADHTTNDYVTLLGTADAADNLDLQIKATEALVP